MVRQSPVLGGQLYRFVMADHVVPHFHNTPGVPVIEIGAREFMCVGATPPFDRMFSSTWAKTRKSFALIAQRSIASTRLLILTRRDHPSARWRIPLPPDLYRD